MMNDKINDTANSGNDINDSIKNASKDKFLILFKKYVGIQLTLWAIFVVIIGIIMIWFSHGKSQSIFHYFLIKEIGKALFLTALISVPVKWFLTRQMDKLSEEKHNILIKSIYDEITKNWNFLSSELDGHNEAVLQRIENHDDCVQSEISKISASSTSLIALEESNIAKVYSSRSDAGEDIISEISSGDIETIQIIGISLNDFTRDENLKFHAIWKTLRDFISGDINVKSDKLSIKILIIDPNSEGAFLRSKAEERGGEPSRLFADVNESMKKLYKKFESNNPKVVFDVRIYRIPPIMFMFRTNSVSFVQQYYFRPNHESGINIPILKYRSSDKPNHHSVHEELNDHFEWIWDNASMSLFDYYEKHTRGVYSSVKEANIANMYFKNETSRRERIKYLIQNTNEILWIKGISLKSFFQLDSDLYYAIKDIAKKENSDVRILLIDPTSEQAKIRSFREYLLTHENDNLDKFDDNKRKKQRLHRETNDSIQSIRNDLVPSLMPERLKSFNVGLYNSAPEAFLLVTDESVLVEQYHYGLIIEEAEHRRILGGNVPLAEYKREYANIYQIFKNNFEYVYKYWTNFIEFSAEE